MKDKHVKSGISSFNSKDTSLLQLKKLGKWAAEIFAIVGIVAGIAMWQTRDMLDTDGTNTIPNQQLVSLDGSVQPLLKEGRKTLVYFWAPWCNICAVSIGSLQSVDSSQLDIVTIALDYESLESVEQFVQEHGVTATVLLGTAQTRQQFQIKGYPSYYLLNEDAQVVAKSFGFNTGIGIRIKQWLADLR